MREKLEAYGPTYTAYSKRRERTLVEMGGRLVCGDPHLELSFRASESHMNALLEDYHDFLNTPEQATVEIPVAGYESRVE